MKPRLSTDPRIQQKHCWLLSADEEPCRVNKPALSATPAAAQRWPAGPFTLPVVSASPLNAITSTRAEIKTTPGHKGTAGNHVRGVSDWSVGWDTRSGNVFLHRAALSPLNPPPRVLRSHHVALAVTS